MPELPVEEMHRVSVHVFRIKKIPPMQIAVRDCEICTIGQATPDVIGMPQHPVVRSSLLRREICDLEKLSDTRVELLDKVSEPFVIKSFRRHEIRNPGSCIRTRMVPARGMRRCQSFNY